jgi:hypothetical protein
MYSRINHSIQSMNSINNYLLDYSGNDFSINQIINYPLITFRPAIQLEDYLLEQGPLFKVKETYILEKIVEEILLNPQTTKFTYDVDLKDVLIESPVGKYNLSCLLRKVNLSHFTASRNTLFMFANYMRAYARKQAIPGLEFINYRSPYSMIFDRLHPALLYAIKFYTRGSRCNNLFKQCIDEAYPELALDLMITCFAAMCLREATLICSDLMSSDEEFQDKYSSVSLELLRRDHRWNFSFAFDTRLIKYNNPVSTSYRRETCQDANTVIINHSNFLPPIDCVSQFSQGSCLPEGELLLPPGSQFLLKQGDHNTMVLVNSPSLEGGLSYELSMAVSYLYKKYIKKNPPELIFDIHASLLRKLFYIKPTIEHLSRYSADIDTKYFCRKITDEELYLIHLASAFLNTCANLPVENIKVSLNEIATDFEIYARSEGIAENAIKKFSTILLNSDNTKSPIGFIIAFSQKLESLSKTHFTFIKESEEQTQAAAALEKYAKACRIAHLMLLSKALDCPDDYCPREAEDILESVSTPKMAEQLKPLAKMQRNRYSFLANMNSQLQLTKDQIVYQNTRCNLV